MLKEFTESGHDVALHILSSESEQLYIRITAKNRYVSAVLPDCRLFVELPDVRHKYYEVRHSVLISAIIVTNLILECHEYSDKVALGLSLKGSFI